MLISFLLLTIATPASAQDASPATTESPARSTIFFLTGAFAGLVAHEAGHVIAGVAFDAHPRTKPIHYGPIPFFAIDHDLVTRRQEFVIASAGFWVQHATSEWILTARPDLATEHAPFLKGMFAFNLASSAVYSVAAFGRFGPPERDTRGMAVTLGDDGVPEPVIGLLVLAPAALDGYRYLHPHATWAKWASRSAKIVGVALTIVAGRE